MKEKKAYIAVNEFAPEREGFSVYFKKVAGKKSDGFVILAGKEIFVLDAGIKGETFLPDYLLSLRERWLREGERLDLLSSPEAKLEIHLIVSHSHPDHVGALPLIFQDPRFSVLSFRAPKRSYRSLLGEESLSGLLSEEERLDALGRVMAEAGHPAKEILRIPYGEKQSIQARDNTLLEIYPAPYDWSEERESDDEGFGFLKKFSSPTYKDNPEAGYTNGILNGNSLWLKATKGSRSVLITGDQRASDEMLGAMIRYYGEEEFRCEVLKLPHHGEKNFPPYLLEVAKAKKIVFTSVAGKGTPETRELCHKIAQVYYVSAGDLVMHLTEEGITAEGILPGVDGV